MTLFRGQGRQEDRGGKRAREGTREADVALADGGDRSCLCN